MQTIVVTGANGFIPSRIIYTLLNEGYRVKGTVRDFSEEKTRFLNDWVPKEAKDRFELVSIPDLKDNVGYDEAFAGCDIVIHTAAPVPKGEVKNPEKDVIKPITNGTKFALEAATKAGVKRFIYMSSVAAMIGKQREKNPFFLYTEYDWNDDMATPYSKARTLAERFLWEYSKNHPEMDIIVFNPSMVLGPVMDKRLFSTTSEIYKLITGVYEDGVPKKTYGLADVRDVADAVLKSITSYEAVGKRIIISSRRCFSLLDIAIAIDKQFPDQFKVNLPRKIKNNDTNLISYEGAFDNSKVTALLGRNLRDVNETLKDTINSFKEYQIV
jgi:nucleoside-diphosphate-sugar epimerase